MDARPAQEQPVDRRLAQAQPHGGTDDDAFAKQAGYPSVFSQGMHRAALLATFATDWLGAENIRRFQVGFRDQVWPGDVLTCRGTVAGIQPAAGGRLVRVELVCERQTGAAAVIGEADFLVPG